MYAMILLIAYQGGRVVVVL